MSRAYSDIAFTPAVRAMQTRMGSRANYAPLDDTDDRRDVLGHAERAFVSARDSFYQATVSETGWPYVQFRGGPAGFLKVLDEKTIAYADFRGNVQYISVGNFAGNDRVSIILMDYANRTRLKILGRVRLVALADDPALIAKLESADYRARIERAVVITIEGFDWNCPQHITPRYTKAEVAAASAAMRDELAALKAQVAQSTAPKQPIERPTALGRGPLALLVAGIRQLTPSVRSYELRAPDGVTLPLAAPGAHIDVPVRLPDASDAGQPIDSTRRYSIHTVSPTGDCYEIAVHHDEAGSGGSTAVHRDYALGTTLHCGMPGNDFSLHADSRPTVLIAGGIGITPIHSMALALAKQGGDVALHYAARSRRDAPLVSSLAATLGDAMTLYFGESGDRLDLTAIMSNAPPTSVFYVCGPSRLIDAARTAARKLGIADDRVRIEHFSAAPVDATDKAVRVTLQRSGKIIDVAASQSILDAVQAAGVEAPASCRSGTCGTCAVKVLAGTPAHRDTALTTAEHEQAGLMCLCVSRAESTTLTLDL